MGFTSASCMAYKQIKGVINPGVSAGSNHTGARVMCIAQVIWPAGSPFCAMATCRRGQPCHVTNPAIPPSVPWSKRRRVSAVYVCWDFGDMYLLLRILAGHPHRVQNRQITESNSALTPRHVVPRHAESQVPRSE